MIYTNKMYAIPDIAKKLHIKEKDIQMLIDKEIIPASDLFGVKFLKGSVIQELIEEIRKFNKSDKEIKEGVIDMRGIDSDAHQRV